MSKVLVLGGWACKPEMLIPYSGTSALFYDVNSLMPQLIHEGSLDARWMDTAAQSVKQFVREESDLTLIGWSTGAIVALAIAMQLSPSRLVLLAPTPSFCRRPGFPFGQRSSTLAAMKTRLLQDRDTVLLDFYSRIGAEEVPVPDYSSGQLCAGLTFLEQVNLLPLQQMSCPVEIIHGTEDAIIPFAAGEFVAEALNTTCMAIRGPHAFFFENGTGPLSPNGIV